MRVCTLFLACIPSCIYGIVKVVCHQQAVVSFQVSGSLGISGILGRVLRLLPYQYRMCEQLSSLSREWKSSPNSCYAIPNDSSRVLAAYCSVWVMGSQVYLYSQGRRS